MRYLKRMLGACLIGYLLLCCAIYLEQESLVFPLSGHPTAIDWQPLRASEQALIKGSCGELSVAIWRRPAAKGTIMMFHGNGETLSAINDTDVPVFHNLGYNVMTWDYPGYGQSTDCWFNQAMLLSDAEAAYQWLAAREGPSNIHLFGYSIGTAIALSVAAKHAQNPVYLVAGYDSVTNVALDHYPYFKLLPLNLLIRFPFQTEQWVSAIRQPIYMVHGVDDGVILPARARAFVKEAKGKAKIEWVENAGHADNILFTYRNQWLDRLLP